MSAGSCSDPWATAAKAPIPRPVMPSRPSTSTDRAVDLPGERLGVLGERGRREVVAGPVLQVARRVDRLGHERRLGDRRLQVRGRGDDQALEALRAFGVVVAGRRRLVALEAVVGQDRPLDERRRRPPGRRRRASQQSVRVDSSRARSRATAAATRARSGVKSSRLPRPTISQRLPSRRGPGASALNERRASPEASSSLNSGGRPGAGSSPSKTPSATVSASVALPGMAWWPIPPSAGARYPDR